MLNHLRVTHTQSILLGFDKHLLHISLRKTLVLYITQIVDFLNDRNSGLVILECGWTMACVDVITIHLTTVKGELLLNHTQHCLILTSVSNKT